MYVVEPQTIFLAELVHLIGAAGGRVARTAAGIDPRRLVPLRADFAVLDLDYGGMAPFEAIAHFCDYAPTVRPIVLTDVCEPGSNRRYRASGAFSVISKGRDEAQTIAALRGVLTGEAFFDPLVDAL